MFEARIDNNQLKELTRELELTERKLHNIAVRVFKTSAKDFSKKVIKRANTEQKISIKKLKQRIKQYVINDLKIKIFNGLFRVGITNWAARQIGKAKPGRKRTTGGRKGVSYGAPGAKRFRENAFIITSKRKDGSDGGKVAFKRQGRERLPIVKQVDDIDGVITPILESEVENFYSIFASRFNKECLKYIK